MAKIAKEYIEALNAYNKLYKKDKLKFIMNELDIISKSGDTFKLNLTNQLISELLMHIQELELKNYE